MKSTNILQVLLNRDASRILLGKERMRKTISPEPVGQTVTHRPDDVGPLTGPRGSRSEVGPVAGTVAVWAGEILGTVSSKKKYILGTVLLVLGCGPKHES
jgi:hypothetical protein